MYGIAVLELRASDLMLYGEEVRTLSPEFRIQENLGVPCVGLLVVRTPAILGYLFSFF